MFTTTQKLAPYNHFAQRNTINALHHVRLSYILWLLGWIIIYFDPFYETICKCYPSFFWPFQTKSEANLCHIGFAHSNNVEKIKHGS